MKISTLIIFTLILSFWGFSSLKAQPGAGTTADDVKEKVEHAVEALDESFNFEKSKKQHIEEIFSDFYEGQQKIKNNIQRPASGLAQGLASQDFQSVRKKNEALIVERDNRLKKELTEDQFKKWKGEIEPSLHKRRK